MAVQERPALAERVYALLGGLGATEAAGPVGPDTELKAIGFDSLAAAEMAAVLDGDLGVDVIECRLVELRTAGELADLVERTAAAKRRERAAYPSGMGRLQGFARRLLGPFCRWWFSMDVRGGQYVPAAGPVVLCMTHESLLAIPLAAGSSPRRIRFMARQGLFAKPSGARFFRALGGFPVARDGFARRAAAP